MGLTKVDGSGQTGRLYYLDWLRVLAVLGVFYAHMGDIFGTLYWHLDQDRAASAWNGLDTFAAQLGMSLFFVLAGASAWFALSSKTSHQFMAARFKRLLIPFAVAFVLLAPLQAYFLAPSTARLAPTNFFAYYPYFFQNMRIGWDPRWLRIYGYHLWFLAFLYVISMAALPLLLSLQGERGKHFTARLAVWCHRPGGLFVLALPIAFIQILLWAPFPDYQSWADFFTWLVIFVYGFLLMADRRFAAAIQRQGKYALGLGVGCLLVLLSGSMTSLFGGWGQAADYSAGYLGVHLLLSLTIWSLLLSALWLGMRFLNFSNPVIRYANEAILPFYIVHQPVLVIIAFYALRWNLAPTAAYLVISTIGLLATLALYELLIRRIKVVRWLFGMKETRSLTPTHMPGSEPA